jgi:hypothetical protein
MVVLLDGMDITGVVDMRYMQSADIGVYWLEKGR